VRFKNLASGKGSIKDEFAKITVEFVAETYLIETLEVLGVQSVRSKARRR
jgi:hypothetical protein